MPGNPAQPESNRRTLRRPPGFDSTKFWPLPILSLRQPQSPQNEGMTEGSNGNRVRLWKRELQVLADELGITITVNHLPPGTSKWNRIEHKLFAFITMNWRAKPLVSYLAIIQLIASTTTKTGLTVVCQLDPMLTRRASGSPRRRWYP